MKYYTLRMLLGINLLAGCLLFQGCGLMNKKSDSDTSTDIPDDGLGPVEVISTDSTLNAPIIPVAPVAPVAPVPLVPAKPLTTPYTIMKGDTISGIAYRYYLRWQDVLAVNPGIDPKRLRIGQVIQLPGHVNLGKSRTAPRSTGRPVKSSTPPKITAPKVSTPVYNGPATTYIVKKGDSLSVIAYKHGIKTSALRSANSLKSDRILVGQKLKIPGAAGKPAAESVKADKVAPPPVKKAVESDPVKIEIPEPPEAGDDVKEVEEKKPDTAEVEVPAPSDANLQTYVVKEGEDVYAVAIRWGVSPKEITALNNLKSIELEPGTELKIPSVK